MTTQAIAQETKGRRRSVMLVTLALGAALASVVSLGSVAHRAEAALAEKTVFTSNRTTGTGVNNPTGDYEIFTMKPDGTGVKQLTFNETDDGAPTLSLDGTKVAFESEGVQTSNPEGDSEVYVMNALDGTGKKNLSNNGAEAGDYDPAFSPDGTKVAYASQGKQTSNQEGDFEVYRVNTLDGKGRKNLTHNGSGVDDYLADFSSDGTKIAYSSRGVQTSNSGGDQEIYRMNTLDGLGKKNLTNNNAQDYNPIFSPDSKKIAYESYGTPTSNPEGDLEVYRLNALDGKGKKNLTNNGLYVDDYQPVFSPDGTKISFTSNGAQDSNLEGDPEVYVMNTLDGLGKQNLTNNDLKVRDSTPDFSRDGTKITYISYGIQITNQEGDHEIYRMNALDGSGQTNLSNNAAVDGAFVKVTRG